MVQKLTQKAKSPNFPSKENIEVVLNSLDKLAWGKGGGLAVAALWRTYGLHVRTIVDGFYQQNKSL